MASYGKQFLFLFCVAFIFVTGDPKLELDNTKDCEVYCHQFSISVDEPKSCDRGCRLFAISHLLTKDSGDSLARCHQSCEDAYSPLSAADQKSCGVGCEHQSHLTTEHSSNDGNKLVEEGGEGKPEPEAAFNLGTPVMQVRKVMAQVMGGIHIIKTSIITYFLQDDQTLLAVQSDPVTIIEVAAPEGSIPSAEDAMNKEEEKLEASNGRGRLSVMHKIDDGGLFAPSGFAGEPDAVSVSRMSLSSNRGYAYLLHLLLLLAVVSLSLLGLSYCLAIARHQQRKTLKAGNIHVALQHEPLKLVRPEDLTKLSLMEEEDGQAPPLPCKQDLALTHANI